MPEPLHTRSCGVIYVVSGGRSYLGELMTSLRSLRRHEPDLPVTVFSSFHLPAVPHVRREELDASEHPLKSKVYCLRRSPFEHTLFLDTDTTVRGPVRPLFDQFADRDFCVANAHVADYSTRPPTFLAMVKPGRFNTGVLLFRKTPATTAFLSRWEDAVRAQDPADMWAGHNCDQHHFNLLVEQGVREETGLKWADLDNATWNCRGVAVPHLRAAGRWQGVRILHHRTTAMKLRKLAYSVADPGTIHVLAAKGRRAVTQPWRTLATRTARRVP